MKTVILCRHAKSDWPMGVSDLQRPLKERGQEDAVFLAQLLRDQEFMPDRIISSPAKRAMQTADLVRSTLGYEGEVSIAPSVYEEGTAELVQLIRGLPDSLDSVMIFGHNPTMENALTYLLGAAAAFELPTSAMACLEMRGWHWKDFSPKTIHLRWLLVPRLNRHEE